MPRPGVSKSTAVTADYSDVEAIQKRMVEAADSLSAMVSDLAKARQIREFESDRRKHALAEATLPFLSEHSATAAEVMGRASADYRKAMVTLGNQLVAAEKVIAEHDAMKIQWETARSLLAMQRDMTRQL